MPKSAEKCQEIRKETKEKILKESMLYFAKNGFAGTKISDLARHIGIGQGTIYVYFESKEALFNEIYAYINAKKDLNELKLLSCLPISAKAKLSRLSVSVLHKLEQDSDFAAKVTLNAQILIGNDNSSSGETTYQSELYKYTSKIIGQGQREGSMADGTPLKLADYYWSVIYLYSLKQLFSSKYEMITADDLNRILLRADSKEVH